MDTFIHLAGSIACEPRSCAQFNLVIFKGCLQVSDEGFDLRLATCRQFDFIHANAQQLSQSSKEEILMKKKTVTANFQPPCGDFEKVDA